MDNYCSSHKRFNNEQVAALLFSDIEIFTSVIAWDQATKERRHGRKGTPMRQVLHSEHQWLELTTQINEVGKGERTVLGGYEVET